MLARVKNFLRRRVRGIQRGRQYPLLLPHYAISGDGALRSADGSNRAPDARLTGALKLCDGRRTLAAVVRESGCPAADLIGAHDDGLLLFWRGPVPAEPPVEPRALHGIILSPHPDDAALSCGGRMLGDRALLVVNVFSRSVWWRFPFTADDGPRIQACRDEEERLVSRLSGCAFRALGLPEALLRGYSMETVFAAAPGERNPDVVRGIREAVGALAAEHPLVHWYLPLGVGDHVDHRMVRDVGRAALRAGGVAGSHVHYYEDLPYAAKRPGADYSAAVEGVRLRREVLSIEEQFPWKVELLRAYWSQFRWSDLAGVRGHAREVGGGEAAEAVWTEG